MVSEICQCNDDGEHMITSPQLARVALTRRDPTTPARNEAVELPQPEPGKVGHPLPPIV
jgi:hypothetical protein